AVERGQPALELAAAMRVRRDARGRLAVQTRADLSARWRGAPELECLAVLDTALLVEHALEHAARAHLAHAIGICGLDPARLKPEDRAYALRRLRADLFPPAATTAVARRVRALLLNTVLESRVRRAVFLIHGKHARYRDFNEALAAGPGVLVQL